MGRKRWGIKGEHCKREIKGREKNHSKFGIQRVQHKIKSADPFREVVNSRKSVNKIYAAKANLNSVQLQMKGQLAQVIFGSDIGHCWLAISPQDDYNQGKINLLRRWRLLVPSQAAPMWWRPCSSWYPMSSSTLCGPLIISTIIVLPWHTLAE